MRLSTPSIIALLCLAEVLTMLGVFSFPALMPVFQDAWGLTNTEAGWISGVTFGAYALAAPVLISLTDRVDARWLFCFGAGLAAMAAAGFAWLAEGFLSALVLRALGGIGLAGTYMPGLRMLVDRIPREAQARAVPFYTASFSLGTALSYFVSGQVGAALGWPWAFGAAAAGAAVAAIVAMVQRPVTPQRPEGPPVRLLDFRPVLRNRPAMGYVLGYAAHTWELFAFRSWVVAFLVAAGGAAATGWSAPATVATWGALVAMAASIGGAEVASRLGRPRTVMVYMVLSCSVAAGLGFTIGLPYGVVAGLSILYSGLIQLDSAALTSGAVEMAEAGRRGATLAVHSLLGFLAGFLGPLALGMTLDAGGWGWAFFSVAAVALLGPLGMWWGSRAQNLSLAKRPSGA
ncbi:MAG: MFS transporter [Rhodospirillaceae bacterium]